ncbi:MAG: AMP-dependent synthetase/ligase [Terriglobia bacterium]
MNPSPGFATLSELFITAAEKRSRPNAFLSKRAGRYEPLSSREALRQAAALALAFEDAGIRRGDRLALLSENRVEWALTDYAALGAGIIDVPIYPTLPASDIEFILRDSGCRGIVVSTAGQLGKVRTIKERLPGLKWIVSMDPPPPGDPGVHSWRDLIRQQLERNPQPEGAFRQQALEVKPEGTATLIYTSGTTGAPKGVVLTHANIASNVQACMPLFQFGAEDRALSFLPLSHILERMLEYFVFWSGASIAYAESLENLGQNILETHPTIMAVVPRVLEKVHGRILEAVRQGSASKRRLFQWAVKAGWRYASCGLNHRRPGLSLRAKHRLADALVGSKIRVRLGGKVRYLISGAAPLAPELTEFYYAMGLPVYEGYGLTETSPVVSVNFPGRVKLGTVGPAIPGVEIKLGKEAAESGAGREIMVRGPNVSPGYYNREDESSQVFAGGWLRTGDLGRLDSDGFLSITGRKKNLIKTSGGKYVSPEKLEGLFQGHPFIAQMLVLGNSRHFVAALIVPNFERLEAHAREKEIRFNSREELVAHPESYRLIQQKVDEVCAGLAPFERIHQAGLLPREFTVDSGELSPSQKIRRFVVEERYRELIEEIYRRPAPQKSAGAIRFVVK